jgi:type I restriction enzyme S subunit
VAQNSADEPALSMLSKKHALPANYKRMKKRIKDSPVALPVHLFPPVPRGWVYESIQKLYDQNVIIDYGDGNHGELYPRKGEFTAEGVTFVTAAQIAGGKVQWPSCLKLAAAKAKELTKGWAGGEDVLLTHNATVGRAAIVEADVEKFLLGTSVTFYRLNSQVLSNNYFYLCLISPIWQDQLSQVMQQTTRNQVSIQKQAFFRIPIPPIEEQKRIVAKVSQLMSLCDEVEAKLCEAETTSQKLLNAVVHHVLRAVESVS